MAGSVDCTPYERMVGEYVSCIEPNPDNYATYTTQAQVQAAFAAFTGGLDFRCQIGAAYYSQCTAVAGSDGGEKGLGLGLAAR